MSAAGFVRVTEVGPRDGLQNERTTVPVEEKVVRSATKQRTLKRNV